LKILNYTLIQQSKIVTNAFKENKIRNKGIDILAQENQTPVAIADIAKAKIFRLSFLESILCFCVILVFGC
jgi:hypothetical protein